VTAHRSNPRAFTIIELITIVVIIGVLAGVTVPRLLDLSDRAVMGELRDVADVLSSAGVRESLSSTPVAIEYRDSTFRLLTLRAPDELTPWSGYGQWVEDPLARPVRLDLLALGTASAGGQVLDREAWRVSLSTLEARPAIALGLADRSGRAWAVWLASDADRASIAELGVGVTAEDLQPGPIDLDASGREEDPW
jgi:hypothetical protein